MIRAILGTLGILVALGIAVYFLSHNKTGNEPASKPPAQTQVAVQPAPATGPKPGAPNAQPPVSSQPTPPISGPAAPPAVVPVPTPPPTAPPPQVEKKIAPLPTLEPKKEPALVAGKFRHYKDAQRRLDKIKKKHLPGFIRKEGKYYQVWVGPFKTPQQTERAGKSLRTTLKLSPQKREYEVPVPK
jgi:hypothetical protein